MLRDDNDQLFISIIKPHGPVTSSTIARWLKEVMAAAGIDTSTVKAHSVRSASTSAASMQGVTLQDIQSAADWGTEPIRFKSFITNQYGILHLKN